jgi:prevent-host-death family protein
MSILTFNVGHIMTWNIAQAKQQFSEVVRLSAQEPQVICNRDKPVAVLINADEFEAFQQWRAGQHEPTLAAQFAESRLALQQAGADLASAARGLGRHDRCGPMRRCLARTTAAAWPDPNPG